MPVESGKDPRPLARLRRMPVQGVVKICGLNTTAAVEAAMTAGADMLGFVFYPRSPRHLTHPQAAELVAFARHLSAEVAIVALTVDASDTDLAAIVSSIAPDWLQLHGSEPPDRVALIRDRFGARAMKAVGIADAADIEKARRYSAAADLLLLDAKPAAGAPLPGGNGIPFDHRLIAGQDFGRPILLSGGLTPENVAAAVALTRPYGVDVSSGVEAAPGVKDIGRIRAFVAAAREALDSAAQ